MKKNLFIFLALLIHFPSIILNSIKANDQEKAIVKDMGSLANLPLDMQREIIHKIAEKNFSEALKTIKTLRSVSKNFEKNIYKIKEEKWYKDILLKDEIITGMDEFKTNDLSEYFVKSLSSGKNFNQLKHIVKSDFFSKKQIKNLKLIPFDANKIVPTINQGLSLTPLIATLWYKNKELFNDIMKLNPDVNKEIPIAPGILNAGTFALLEAAKLDDVSFVKNLVKKGANINKEVSDQFRNKGQTALQVAKNYRNKAVVEYLKSVGAEEK